MPFSDFISTYGEVNFESRDISGTSASGSQLTSSKNATDWKCTSGSKSSTSSSQKQVREAPY